MIRRLAATSAPLLLLLGSLSACADGFKDDCLAQGGEILEDTDTNVGTGISPTTGQPVVVTTTSTTRLCVVDGDVVAID